MERQKRTQIVGVGDTDISEDGEWERTLLECDSERLSKVKEVMGNSVSKGE